MISKTFTEVTPESAEECDFSDSGFIYERQSFKFRELVDELEAISHASCSAPVTIHTYVTESAGITDYRTCVETEYCYHFADDPKKVKYWQKAVNYVFNKQKRLRESISAKYL
jgi:hypothetical protein